MNLDVTDQLLSDFIPYGGQCVIYTQTSSKHMRRVLVMYNRVCVGEIRLLYVLLRMV